MRFLYDPLGSIQREEKREKGRTSFAEKVLGVNAPGGAVPVPELSPHPDLHPPGCLSLVKSSVPHFRNTWHFKFVFCVIIKNTFSLMLPEKEPTFDALPGYF